MWTVDGDYVNAAGQTLKAQDLIARMAPAAEPTGGSDPVDPPQSTLRFVAPSVAIEDGAVGHGAGDEGVERAGRFSAVWVKRDGKWLLASLRESAAALPPGKPELRPLAWLVGQWAGGDGEAAIIMSWDWSDNGHYLVGEYLIYGSGGEVVSGSQRLGWDPATKQIKSWTFNSQGGSGEGHWRRDGERWVVNSLHVTADGKTAKSAASYVVAADGRLNWEVKCDWDASDATQAGADLPVQRFEFRRSPAEQ
jgi:hypothetical protein